MYLRLSVEDADLGLEKTESASISNQREHLKNYLKDHPDIAGKEVKEFIDDGYSGSSFNRPAVKKLLADILAGAVGCVIVKDFSRFGRNYLAVGSYLEEVFPALQVRFISVDDHYDSENDQGNMPELAVVFKNIIHDYYCKELSDKVIRAKRNLAAKGLFLASFPPFGYVKDAEDKHHLVIEPESSGIVRRIFSYALAGKSNSEIARIMNQEGAESPARRLWRLGLRKGVPKENELRKLQWNAGSIRSILGSEAVIGRVTNHKVERKRLGQPDVKRVCPQEHIVAETMHEAIIEQEVFGKVQKLLSARKRKG